VQHGVDLTQQQGVRGVQTAQLLAGQRHGVAAHAARLNRSAQRGLWPALAPAILRRGALFIGERDEVLRKRGQRSRRVCNKAGTAAGRESGAGDQRQ
jgi:hypothetical protein